MGCFEFPIVELQIQPGSEKWQLPRYRIHHKLVLGRVRRNIIVVYQRFYGVQG